jgi:hypothetical protein
MKSRLLDGRWRSEWALGLAGFALGAALLVVPVWADDAAPGARAVRLSSVEGQVELSQGGQLLANPAVENTPLFEGSLIVTGDDGRAEIQFEDGSVARLSPNSSLTLAVLHGQGSNAEAQIAVETGLGYFELQGAGLSGTISVRFSDSTVTASGYTVLRVNLDNAPGELAVFSGNAHLERGNAITLDLHGGESVALNSSDPSHYNLSETIEPDSWDTWNSDRDEALSAGVAARTGATKSFPDATNPAWSDLDASGNWYNVPDQGYIWSPNEAADAGFDPYGNGNWMWTPGYGYIWLSGYSWGYTPFHCGTWNYYDAFGWGWAPGMGGCRPWWGGGILNSNIGIFPPGYHGIQRPPHPPRGHMPVVGGNHRMALPMIAVNRHGIGSGTTLPARDRSSVVSIAGYTVQAMHPISPRPQYDHSSSGYVGHATLANGTRVTGLPSAQGSSHPIGTVPAVHPTGGVSAPRSSSSSAGSASHAPSGGGGHVSSGGGGGGGGGHASTGGGGHK